MAESLILSDGTRTYDFLATSAAIYVAPDGIGLPVVSKDNTYAEGSDSEGRTRIRSRAQNSEAGSLTLQFRASTAATFWDAIDNLQELVESAHLNKGTLAYTKYGSTSSVTYDLESIQVTGLPIKGVHSAQRHAEATITFESKPYGRLATQRLNVQDTYQQMVTALSPSIFLPLGASSGLTDLSGNARNGTAAGGVTVGGATGPLTVSDGGATDFDGTDDRITTTYATRRNLCTNPRAGAAATTGWSTAAGLVNAGATITAVNDWRDTAFQIATTGAATLQGASTLFNLTSGVPQQARIRLKRTAGTGTMRVSVTRNSAPYTSYVVVAAGTQTDFSEVTLDFTPDFTGEWALIVEINEASATTFRFAECMVSAAGSYFDGSGYYNGSGVWTVDGETGWTGAANASASDIGCFANGTSRTFMGWAYRDTSSGADALLGTEVSPGPIVRLNSAANTLSFFPTSAAAQVTWNWPGNTVWVHWALVFDEPGDTAALYINGALVSSQTMASQFATGGNFRIGTLTGTSDPFDGKQAWVSVHQTALTATQIRDCYDTGKAQITLDGPIDSFTVESIPGQVPALPVLTLDDASTQARNIVEVGVQHDFDPDNPEDLELDLAAGLTAQGGSSNTRAGSVATNIIRAALATTPISICKAASQTHKGLWKVRARVYPSATTVLVRLAWRAGDGPFAKEKWVAVPSSAGWFDLDLGTVNIKELPSGHSCEFRIEGKSTSGSPTVDVDIVECIPADSYTKLRGSSSPEVGSGAIVAMDDFSTQTAGAVTGKTPLLAPAGLWSGAGDTDDFTVDTTNQWIIRSAVSDSSQYNGRYLRCGSSTLISAQASVDVLTLGGFAPPAGITMGLILRYTDVNNWLMARLETFVSGGGSTKTSFALVKSVGGVTTASAGSGIYVAYPIYGWRTITASVDASGNAVAQYGVRGGTVSETRTFVADTDLATAGALATGGYGIYDSYTASTGSTRYYDNFMVSTLATTATVLNPAINSGYGLDLKHNTALTDNSTGTSTGTTPIRQGNYPKLPPATRNGLKSRVVVRARRDDNDLGLADSGTSDTMTASLTVTPRVHLTGT